MRPIQWKTPSRPVQSGGIFKSHSFSSGNVSIHQSSYLGVLVVDEALDGVEKLTAVAASRADSD